jgi:hypothetical protein
VACAKPPSSLGPGADTAGPGAGDPAPDDLGPGDLGPAEALSRMSRRLAVTGLRLVSLCQNLDRPEERVALIQAAEELDKVITEIGRLATTPLVRSD